MLSSSTPFKIRGDNAATPFKIRNENSTATPFKIRNENVSTPFKIHNENSFMSKSGIGKTPQTEKKRKALGEVSKNSLNISNNQRANGDISAKPTFVTSSTSKEKSLTGKVEANVEPLKAKKNDNDMGELLCSRKKSKKTIFDSAYEYAKEQRQIYNSIARVDAEEDVDAAGDLQELGQEFFDCIGGDVDDY